jgi:hypothetical protein
MKVALPLLFLLLFGAVSWSTAQTRAYTIAIKPGESCVHITNCIARGSDQGNGGEGSEFWFDESSSPFVLFQYSYPNSLECFNPTYTVTPSTISVTCTGVSSYDGTSYSISVSESYSTYQAGGRYGGVRYLITGGTFTLTASPGTLSSLGV